MMPGIHLLLDWNQRAGSRKDLFAAAQREVKHNERYSDKMLYDDPNCLIGCTTHQGYSVTSFDAGNIKVIVDGFIHDKDEQTVRSELTECASLLSGGDDGQAAEWIANWIANTDGEYNVIFYDAENRTVSVFSDILGMLPLYSYRHDDFMVLSREFNFIVPFLEQITLERKSLAEYVLFSSTLGDRTLVSQIRRMDARQLMSIRAGERKVAFQPTYVFNLDQRIHADRSVEENALEVKRLLMEGCRNRYEAVRQAGLIVNVSLTGGLDSRTVALGLKSIDARFQATTFVDEEKERYGQDARLSKIIADKLGISRKLFQIHKVGQAEAERSIRYKGGLNNVGMAFILNYFDDIIGEYGSQVSYWSGDEGNESIADNAPWKRIGSMNELVDVIVENFSQTSLDRVAELFDVDGSHLKENIREIVAGHPETVLDNKFLHFFHFQYNFRLQYEGQDRNRIFFRQVAPLYGTHVIKYLYNIPNRQKRYHRLYRALLLALSPEVAEITNSNWDYPVTSRKRIWRQFIRQCYYNLRPYTLPLYLKKVLREKRHAKIDAPSREDLLQACRSSKIISEHLLPRGLEDVLSNREMRKQEYYNLWTIVLLIRRLEERSRASSRTVTVV
jgi:asparagine synthase (glutamine-hydrolysing)